MSTLQEMLQATLPEPAQQEQFAQLYAQYQGDWAASGRRPSRRSGAGPAKQLQLPGQLYYLTVNNQPLVAALHGRRGRQPAHLRPGPGRPRLLRPGQVGAADRRVDPARIPGADAAEQAGNYAQLLAAQVRIAYPDRGRWPTRSSANILPIADTADIAAGVASFLTAHQGDFEIGVEPVEAYIARTGLSGTPTAVVTQVKRLQRVYQLTPDDTSMAVLLHHNLDSAFAITRYDAAGFTRAFGDKLGGTGSRPPRSTRGPSRSSPPTLSVTAGYLGGRVAPALGGQAPIQYGYPAAVGPARPTR